MLNFLRLKITPVDDFYFQIVIVSRFFVSWSAMKKIIYLLPFFLIFQCQKEQSDPNSTINTELNKSKDSVTDLSGSVEVSNEVALKKLNDEILASLKAKDYQTFSRFIHPEKGISFSMYGHIKPEKDKHFTREDFIKYKDQRTKFTWGESDGTGDLLVLTIKEYLKDWVFKKDFTTGTYYLNEFKGSGNSLNNLENIYPELDFTENYLPGTEEFGGMDWNSLRFVFDEYEGKKFVVAVVNDQWTI